MRNILLSLLLLLLTACTPQPKPSTTKKLPYVTIEKNNTKEMIALKTALSQYTQATIDNDIDTLVSFIYPKAFTVVSKEEMLTMLKKTFNSGRVPKVKNIKHIKIEPIQTYDKGLYSIITSSMTTILKSPNPNNRKIEEDILKMLKDRLASRGTVTFDSEKHLFNIQHTNKTMAINENGSWKFVGFKQAEKYISNNIFPIELIDKLLPN